MGHRDGEHFPRPHERRHTDVPCLVALCACVAAMSGAVAYSWVNGDTRRLTHAFDYNGRLCGIDAGVEDKPFLYYCGSLDREGEFPRRLHYHSKTCVAACPANGTEDVECLMRAWHNFTELGGARISNVTFVSTLNVDITQTVTLQKAYPTESFKGRYCVPQYREDNSLREDITNGPLRKLSHFDMAVGSLMNAFPVLVLVALLAVALGLAYLYLLQRFAGPLIFASLCVGTALLCAMGLCFLVAVFVDPWNEDGWYQRINPLFCTVYSENAKIYSVAVGMLLVAMGLCMGFTTMYSLEKIDESVGVIHAACECIFADGRGRYHLLMVPIGKGFVIMALFALLAWGLMLVASVGYIQSSSIYFNDQPVESLEKNFRYHPWWRAVIAFYIACSFWLFEIVIAVSHFAVSYTVCNWYFVKNNPQANSDHSMPVERASKGQYVKHVDGVRVHGVNSVKGERHGYIERGPAGKVLVVPIGRKGPDGRDFRPQAHIVDRKEMRSGAVIQAVFIAIVYHTGSLAKGALVSTVTRPFRWVSQFIKVFLSSSHSSYEPGSLEEEEKSPRALFLGGCSLLSGILDQTVGGYSKNAYVDMVLSSADFCTAAKDAFEFIVEAGGIVAFLHGSTALYEMIGVVCIAAICSGTTLVLLTQVPFFRDDGSSWYVNDPWMMTLVSVGISCTVAFGFMSLFNNTADTLLYVFAWSRKHHSDDIELYCPSSLKHIVRNEMDNSPVDQLQSHRFSQYHYFRHGARNQSSKLMNSIRGSNDTGGRQESDALLSNTYRP